VGFLADIVVIVGIADGRPNQRTVVATKATVRAERSLIP